MQHVPAINPNHINSVPVKPLANDTSLAPSLFQQSLLSPKSPKPKIHYSNYDYLLALILFFFYAVYVWLYVANRKRLNQLIKGFYFNRPNTQLSRDEYSGSNRMGVLLSLLFLFTITLFSVQVIDYYGIPVHVPRYWLYGIVGGSLVLMYLVKVLTVRLSGFVFKTSKEASEYIATLFLFINVLGLFMLPVVTCLAFVRQIPASVFVYTGCFFIAGFLCVRLVRGVVIGFSSNRVSKFYLFLYLCTLEIIPFVVLVKLFMLFV